MIIQNNLETPLNTDGFLPKAKIPQDTLFCFYCRNLTGKTRKNQGNLPLNSRIQQDLWMFFGLKMGISGRKIPSYPNFLWLPSGYLT